VYDVVKAYMAFGPPERVYQLVKEVVGPGVGWEASDIHHVYVIIATQEKTMLLSGACTKKQGGSGPCDDPEHAKTACRGILDDLEARTGNSGSPRS
jgi:hypothetical protein